MRRLTKFVDLPWRDRWLLIEAFLVIGFSRLALLLLPFRWIAPWIGRHMEATAVSQLKKSRQAVNRVQWAVSLAARHTPWRSECLVQAMAAVSMLRRRGVGGTVYLGVAKDPSSKLKAHAWLRCGDSVVIGAHGKDDFTVISTFAFTPRSG